MTIERLDLYVYLLYFSLIKAYFIPDTLRQVIKIGTLLVVFMFLVEKLNRSVVNCSLLYSLTVIISGVHSYVWGTYTVKALLDSLLYVLAFYDLYGLFLYANRHKCEKRMARDLYQINFIYCVLTILSVLYSGVDNNSNVSKYLFGNKFTASYLFISLISLYGLSHNMNLQRNKRRLCEMIIVGLAFTIYVGCATATIAVIAASMLFWIEKKTHSHILQNPYIAGGALIGTAIVPFVINSVINNRIINYIIFDLFHRGYTVYGRFRIYNEFLYDLLKNRFWLGYGYSNGVMRSTTEVFSNAQNGLLEQMMNFGIVGVVAILITMFYALRKKRNLSYMVILLYAMIVAAIFEITINWFFWIALFSIQFIDSDQISSSL